MEEVHYCSPRITSGPDTCNSTKEHPGRREECSQLDEKTQAEVFDLTFIPPPRRPRTRIHKTRTILRVVFSRVHA